MQINELINNNYARLKSKLCKSNTDKAIDGVSNEDILHNILLQFLEDNTEFHSDKDFIDEVIRRVKIGMFRIKANSKTNANTTIEESKEEEREE